MIAVYQWDPSSPLGNKTKCRRRIGFLQNKKVTRLEPRGWIEDGYILESKINCAKFQQNQKTFFVHPTTTHPSVNKVEKGPKYPELSPSFSPSPSPSPSFSPSLPLSVSLSLSLPPSLPRSHPLSPLPLPLKALCLAREKVPATYGNSHVLT